MFNVPSLTRAKLDSWPIREAGLPTRIANSAQRVNIDTVGELRALNKAEISALPAVGRISIKQLRSYFSLCERIERGTQVFITIQELFDLFLDADEIHVLVRRYGLLRLEHSASRNFMTLQEIANESRRTRERIRQVEKQMHAQLTHRMARHCLQPFLLYTSRFIASRGMAVTYEECADLEGQSWLAGYNPSALLLLLRDVSLDAYSDFPGGFSCATPTELERAQRAALKRLDDEARPMKLADLHTDLVANKALNKKTLPAPALAKVLDHGGEIGATLDGRYFSFHTGVADFLEELMQTVDQPTHYRTLTSAFNRQVKPASRKGSGFLLRWLPRSPRIIKTHRGLYRLREA